MTARPRQADTTANVVPWLDLAEADLPGLAARVVAELVEHFPAESAPLRQVLALVEETGELTDAYTALRDHADQPPAAAATRDRLWNDVVAEFADVVITLYVTAAVLIADARFPPILVPLPVDQPSDIPAQLLELQAAAAQVAGSYRRVAGMARRRGDPADLAAALDRAHAGARGGLPNGAEPGRLSRAL